GFLNYDGGNSENTNVLLLTDPKYAQLGPYSKDPALYKCPTDRSKVKIGKNKFLPRVRSVSMNAYAGGVGKVGIVPDPIKFGPQKQSEIIAPANLFVFIDEHPDSIDFVSFLVENRMNIGRNTFGSCPSSLHNSAGTVSFADGHVELHRWKDDRTKTPVTYSTRFEFDTTMHGNPDLQWLQERSFQ